MDTITVILEPDVDGFVHLPVPAELRGGKVKVVASVESFSPHSSTGKAKLVEGEFGRPVLVAPPGAPPMTPDRIKAILADE